MKEKSLQIKEKTNVIDKKKIVEDIRFLFPELENVPSDEIIKAVYLAKHYELDPLKREVYFVPFNIYDTDPKTNRRYVKKKTVQLIVSYLEYIKRAERSEKLDGWSVQIKREGTDFVAEVTIWRKDWRQPFVWNVYLSEVKKDTRAWREMPKFMLRKVAIAQAFRIAFPEELAGMPYEEAEIITEDYNKDIQEEVKTVVKKFEKQEKQEKEEKKENLELKETEEIPF